MRVLTGAKKSRKLLSRVSDETRPTSSRVRKSIFDILWSRFGIEGKSVLDLFAGTGALGIEALSRGAELAYFVDESRRATDVIRENLSRLEIEPFRFKVINSSYKKFIRDHQGDRFDIAILDPPYAFSDWDELLDSVPAAVIVCETGKPMVTQAKVMKLLERKYGTTVVTLFEGSNAHH